MAAAAASMLGPKRRARDKREQEGIPSSARRLTSRSAANGCPTGTTRTRSSSKSGVTADVGSRRREVENSEIDLAGRQLSVEPGGRGLDEDEAEQRIPLRSDARSTGARATGQLCR